MPKIIPNIHSRIESVALTLFNQYDYNQVDMKMIASQCEIAVGTLYNYYPNKHHLFLHVMRLCWEETARLLDDLFLEPTSCLEEKLSLSIALLYDHLSERRGMGKYIYKIISSFEFDPEVIDLFDIIFIKLARLFEGFEKKSFSCETTLMNRRLAHSLIVMIENTLLTYPNNREDNLHYIQDFFYNSMHVDFALKKNYLKSH